MSDDQPEERPDDRPDDRPEESRTDRLQSLRRSTRGRISFVWAIPIVAILLGASLVVQTYLAKGPTIEIEFPVAAGIKVGATPIKLLDVEVGLVVDVRLNESLDGIVAVAELDSSAAAYLEEGTIFWLVQPRLSLAGISGLETLLSGQFIQVVPGPGGATQSVFQGRMDPPIGVRYPNGKSIVLETEQLGSIAQGTPIYHRGLLAGEVEHYELADGEGAIRVYAMIDEAFTARVRENSLFWNASGVDARIGLGGVEIRTEGVEAILAGGIAFSTPTSEGTQSDVPEASANSVFRLHAGADGAREAHQQSHGLMVELESRDAVGLTPGTPIDYRGLEIGRIAASRLTRDGQAVRLTVFIAPRFRPLLVEGTRFYKSSGIDLSVGLDGVRVRTEGLRSVALGGVSIAVPGGENAPVERGALFALHDAPREEWLEWKPSVALDGIEGGESIEHVLPPDPNAGSLELVLMASDATGLGVGSPVHHRSVPVGEVIRTELRDEGEAVSIRIRIDARHRRLVGTETHFWRKSAISVDLGFGGLAVDVGSLRELALGGIEFGDSAGRGEAARYGARFELHANQESAFAEFDEARFLHVSLEAHASSLREGAPVYFRRFPIGEVGATHLTSDAQAVRVELRIERAYADLVREDSLFWAPDAIHLEASLAGVELDAPPIQALIEGGVMLATPSATRPMVEDGRVFRLEESAPAGWMHWHPELQLSSGVPATYTADLDTPEGVQLVIVAPNIDALGDGDPIFYRGLQIGSLGASRLGADGQRVLIDALIAPEYAAVVRSNTQVWNASGFEVDLSWGGVEAQTGPLETLIRGGIQLATPDPAGARAASGDRFILRSEPEEGWESWAPVLR